MSILSCIPAVNSHISLCSKDKNASVSTLQPLLKNNRHFFDVKNLHSQPSSGLHGNLQSTVKIFSNIQDAYSFN